MIYVMCKAHQALPDAGGILDQDVSMMRRLSILRAGGFFDNGEESPPAAPVAREPWEDIPMVVL